MPLPNEASPVTAAIDIFTASSSTDFAYAYATYSHIVLSHSDLGPGICFVMDGNRRESVWVCACPLNTSIYLAKLCFVPLCFVLFGTEIPMKDPAAKLL